MKISWEEVYQWEEGWSVFFESFVCFESLFVSLRFVPFLFFLLLRSFASSILSHFKPSLPPALSLRAFSLSFKLLPFLFCLSLPSLTPSLHFP